MPTRRQFIKGGIATALAVGVARMAYGPFSTDPTISDDPAFRYRFLDAKHRAVIYAIAPIMLAGAIPESGVQRETVLLQVVHGVDTAIAGLPPAVQAELQQLFLLLGFPMTRRLIAGVRRPWLQADAPEIDDFLCAWRDGSLNLLRAGYQALHQLVLAAWYGNPDSWDRIGYPGPPGVVR